MIVASAAAATLVVAAIAPEWAAPLNSVVLLAIAIQQQRARVQAAREDSATKQQRAADKLRRAR